MQFLLALEGVLELDLPQLLVKSPVLPLDVRVLLLQQAVLPAALGQRVHEGVASVERTVLGVVVRVFCIFGRGGEGEGGEGMGDAVIFAHSRPHHNKYIGRDYQGLLSSSSEIS